jgi:hypothetical protein
MAGLCSIEFVTADCLHIGPVTILHLGGIRFLPYRLPHCQAPTSPIGDHNNPHLAPSLLEVLIDPVFPADIQ